MPSKSETTNKITLSRLLIVGAIGVLMVIALTAGATYVGRKVVACDAQGYMLGLVWPPLEPKCVEVER